MERPTPAFPSPGNFWCLPIRPSETTPALSQRRAPGLSLWQASER